jgi:hypothetical protein
LKLGRAELCDSRDNHFPEMEDFAGTQREFHVAVIQDDPLGQAKSDKLSDIGHDSGFGRVGVGPPPAAIALRDQEGVHAGLSTAVLCFPAEQGALAFDTPGIT